MHVNQASARFSSTASGPQICFKGEGLCLPKTHPSTGGEKHSMARKQTGLLINDRGLAALRQICLDKMLIPVKSNPERCRFMGVELHII